MDFIHLHNHTDYSILDGAISVKRLVDKAVQLGMPAIAMTDHGNMFGAIEFYLKARAAGIKPIIGQEFYVTPGSRHDRSATRSAGEDNSYHLVLLARDGTGYSNLVKLSSIGFTEGFYYKPRIDWETLEHHSAGLIASTACLSGQIPSYILRGRNAEARELAGRLSELFGRDHFYLELQDHGIPEQKTVNAELVKMASELSLPLIATNDAHYAERDDAPSHDVLICIQTGKTLKDESRMSFHSQEFYLKSAEEMNRLFMHHPEALRNTARIAEMVDLQLTLGKPILPLFQVPDGYDLDSYLRHVAYEGAKRRFGGDIPAPVKERLDYELSIIIRMKFSGYFLIVWDMISHARATGIPVGPGRGSAAGSMVSYCLGITALDPIRYDLLFERFLNPERNELPDIDLDFCAERRDEIIEYVKKKYGEDRVSQIITFGRLMAKMVLKDVGRVLDIPFDQVNRISKHIKDKQLADAIKNSKELQELRKDPVTGKFLIETSLRLEGLVRAPGKHAAGIVISQGPITDHVPLYRDKDGSYSSQYEKVTLEQAGMVKMDLLGLKNLTIIHRCLGLIKETVGKDLDIDTIPLDDAPTFRLLQKAETRGVFQLESGGMQNLLRRLGPTCFEDIIAVVALFRPGPLNSGMVDEFIDCKRNPAKVSYPHPDLEPVLKDTLGVIVYQEQVMRISQIVAGFTLPEADKLRKAMGKKDKGIMGSMQSKFIEGAVKRNYDRKFATELFGAIEKFSEYAFNKSHSAAYAVVAYQTAYLKANYPLQYMTALLSAQPEQKDIMLYVADCRGQGIKVIPPSVNHSRYDFTIEKKSIRFGLGAIKGVGEKAIDAILLGRERCGGFKNLRDFLENVDIVTVNRGVLESLIKAGAMDELHPHRAQLFTSLDRLLEAGRRLQEDRVSGQGDLFGESSDEHQGGSIHITLEETPEWVDGVKLSHEKEVLGIFVSGHPLARFEKDVRLLSTVSLSAMTEEHNGSTVSIVGILTNQQIKQSKKGKRYLTALLEDLDGTMEAFFFERILNASEQVILAGDPVLVTGTVEAESDTAVKLIATGIKPFKEARREAISSLHIKINAIGMDEAFLKTLQGILQRHHGECPVFFHVNARERETVVRAHQSFSVQPSEHLVKDLSQVIGPESIGYAIGPV